jgi:hypothetical protein
LEDLLESLLNFPLYFFLFLRNLSLLQALLDYSTSCPPSHLQIPWILVPLLPGPGLWPSTTVIQALILTFILAKFYSMLSKRGIHALTVALYRIFFIVFIFLVTTTTTVSSRILVVSLKLFFLLLLNIRFLCLGNFWIEIFFCGLVKREIFIELGWHLLLESLVRQTRVLNLPSPDYFGDTDWLGTLNDTFGCHLRDLLVGW